MGGASSDMDEDGRDGVLLEFQQLRMKGMFEEAFGRLIWLRDEILAENPSGSGGFSCPYQMNSLRFQKAGIVGKSDYTKASGSCADSPLLLMTRYGLPLYPHASTGSTWDRPPGWNGSKREGGSWNNWNQGEAHKIGGP